MQWVPRPPTLQSTLPSSHLSGVPVTKRAGNSRMATDVVGDTKNTLRNDDGMLRFSRKAGQIT